jgi:hypothetical protein
MKGLVRDHPEFGVFFWVKLCWIANLDEIWAYKGDGAPPRIVWTEEGEEGIAELFNGNHQFKMLQIDTVEHLKQWQECVKRKNQHKLLPKPNGAQRVQNQRDEEMSMELLIILQVLSVFQLNFMTRVSV